MVKSVTPVIKVALETVVKVNAALEHQQLQFSASLRAAISRRCIAHLLNLKPASSLVPRVHRVSPAFASIKFSRSIYLDHFLIAVANLKVTQH